MHPSLVIAGQTHLQSYLPAGTPPADGPADVRFGDALVLDGPLPRDEAYWTQVAKAARDGTVAIVWGGDQHDIFLVERQPPLDFVLSTAPDLPLDPRASYVSESQLRAVFAPSFTGLAELIGTLRRAGARVLVAGTTPPLADTESRLARAVRDPRLAELVDDGTTAMTSAFTMQKLWSLVQTMTAEIAEGAGARFVPVPDRLRSADGFLPDRFQGEALYPNDAFGKEMAAELAAAAKMLEDAA